MRNLISSLLVLTVLFGACFGVEATDLSKIKLRTDKTAVTLWWVIFNNPELCDSDVNPGGTRCGMNDLFNPAVEGAVMYATGDVTREGGRVQLVASLYETDGDFFSTSDVDPFGLGNGLIDSMKAEVHLVVRSHGEPMARYLDEQLTAFLEPSCQEMGGPNTCQDIQFSIHLPFADSNEDVHAFANMQPIEASSAQLTRTENAIKVILRSVIK